jgi:hypothetical protein
MLAQVAGNTHAYYASSGGLNIDGGPGNVAGEGSSFVVNLFGAESGKTPYMLASVLIRAITGVVHSFVSVGFYVGSMNRVTGLCAGSSSRASFFVTVPSFPQGHT